MLDGLTFCQKPAAPVIGAESFGHPIRVYLLPPIADHAQLESITTERFDHFPKGVGITVIPLHKYVNADGGLPGARTGCNPGSFRGGGAALGIGNRL